ncbi:hypothetical protein HaLaN_17398, partial [Haematococcus lacustris]
MAWCSKTLPALNIKFRKCRDRARTCKNAHGDFIDVILAGRSWVTAGVVLAHPRHCFPRCEHCSPPAPAPAHPDLGFAPTGVRDRLGSCAALRLAPDWYPGWLACPLRHYEVRPQPNQDLEQLVSAVEELPFLSCNSQVEQASQLLWSFADWAGQSVNSRARMTQVQRNAVMNLLQHLAGGARDGKAGSTPAPLAYFDAHQMNMAAASLGKLRPHLHPDAVTSACAAVAHHGASSRAMRRCSWREWSTLLSGMATAGMQCSSSPELTRLFDQAVQLLPGKLPLSVVGQAISMILWAMAKSGYTGTAQPLLQAVTAANSQGEVMADAKPQDWATLIWATSKLPGCRGEARHLLDRFAARSQAVVPGLSARNVVAALEKREVSDILFSMGLVLWHDKEVCRQLAERAAETMQVGNFPHVATSLYNLARLAHLDSSVRSLAAGLASDSERAAFMREQVLASLPEAEAWRQLLQAEGEHCAGQEG